MMLGFFCWARAGRVPAIAVAAATDNATANSRFHKVFIYGPSVGLIVFLKVDFRRGIVTAGTAPGPRAFRQPGMRARHRRLSTKKLRGFRPAAQAPGVALQCRALRLTA